MTGTCKFCGQEMIVDCSDQNVADRIATEECKCDEGREFRNVEEMKKEAKENAEALFGLDEVPFPDEKEMEKNRALLGMMNNIIDNLAAGTMKRVTIKLNERTSATMFITKEDGIKIKKNYKEEYVLEANHF